MVSLFLLLSLPSPPHHSQGLQGVTVLYQSGWLVQRLSLVPFTSSSTGSAPTPAQPFCGSLVESLALPTACTTSSESPPAPGHSLPIPHPDQASFQPPCPDTLFLGPPALRIFHVSHPAWTTSSRSILPWTTFSQHLCLERPCRIRMNEFFQDICGGSARG